MSPNQYGTLAKAIYYRLHSHGAIFSARPSLPHLVALPLEVSPSESEGAGEMKVVVFPGGAHQRIGMTDFVVGVAGGKLVYSAYEWR
jgi:hypothetical protein